MSSVKNISIKNFLAERGVTPTRENNHSGMYISPLRDERTPSFKVDYNKNLWYDFGAECGGSIVDLVMKLESCSVVEAFAKLKGDEFLHIPTNSRPTTQHLPSPLQVTRVEPLQDTRLINYADSRAINIDIIKRYCQEVHYTLNDKPYFAIGFKGDAGGWELNTQGFKCSTSPKTVTTFNNGSSSCLLFEGFMDMLSYLTMKKMIEPSINMVVLNSVSNLSKAEEFLKSHQNIHCFLDNDEAGRRALARVENLGVEVIDQSSFYRNHKDLNDYLKSSKQVQVIKPIQQPRRKLKM